MNPSAAVFTAVTFSTTPVAPAGTVPRPATWRGKSVWPAIWPLVGLTADRAGTGVEQALRGGRGVADTDDRRGVAVEAGHVDDDVALHQGVDADPVEVAELHGDRVGHDLAAEVVHRRRQRRATRTTGEHGEEAGGARVHGGDVERHGRGVGRDAVEGRDAAGVGGPVGEVDPGEAAGAEHAVDVVAAVDAGVEQPLRGDGAVRRAAGVEAVGLRGRVGRRDADGVGRCAAVPPGSPGAAGGGVTPPARASICGLDEGGQEAGLVRPDLELVGCGQEAGVVARAPPPAGRS